ncbi:MAG: hypothetical protein BGO10_06920 [Chlamydia sp. 32-24]|nr:MAG: hypothetical protein BGO10_06920 [Chlamydia sp. 32-24]
MRHRFFLYSSIFSLLGVLSSCNKNNGDVVEQAYIHRYGMEVSPEHWEASGREGQIVSTMKNGVVVSKGYRNGVLDGETTYTYPHSSIIEKKICYDKNNLTNEKEFYRNGAPKIENCIHNDGKEVFYWYPTGIPQGHEQYQNDSGLYTGEYYDINNQPISRVHEGYGKRIVCDEYGALNYEDNIENGQLITRTTYYPNKSPKELIPFKNNQINGQKRTYFIGGEPASLEEWQNNQQHGITITYENGEKVSECPYHQGQKHGVEKLFSHNNLVEEITWQNGSKHGPNIHYINNQKRTDWFFNNQPVSKSQFDLKSNPPPR